MENRFKKAEIATWIGIVANLFLAIMKGIAGVISGSRALIADAAHSASDVVSSIAVLAGIRAAQKPPDKEHPYGHGKAENVAAIIVAILLVVVGIEIALSSFKVFFGEIPKAPTMLAIVVILISIVVKEILFQYKYRLGKKINSPALIAEAWHHRSDVLSSVAAFVGIGGAIIGSNLGYAGFVYLDPLAGVVVAILVIKMGYQLAKESTLVMLEQVLDKEASQQFLETANKVSGVLRVDELHARTHGHYIIIDIKVGVNPALTVEDGHRISKDVKQSLLKNHSEVKNVLVHINPYRKKLAAAAE